MWGRSCWLLSGLLVGVLFNARPAGAQSGSCAFLCAPTFVLQPGVVVTEFLDPTELPGGGEADTQTEFNFRIVTAIPTAIPRTTLVGIVQWTPFAERDDGTTANAPAFVYGPVVNIINTRAFALDLDLLGSFGPAAEADDESDYTHKLVFEADAFFKIGQLFASDSGNRFSQLSIYAMLAHVATGIPDNASPWVLLAGLSLPIAP